MAEALGRLTFCSGTVTDHTWHFLLYSEGPDKWLEYREDQKAWMGRYGRQPWDIWDRMLLNEMEDAYRAIGRLVKAENDAKIVDVV